MRSNLYHTAKQLRSGDTSSKALSYYRKYDDFLNHWNVFPSTVLEIGVWYGESTKILATTFPNAKIVAVDKFPREIDFTSFPNVTYLQSDQTDKDRLTQIILDNFPNGIDLVIEDASHIGSLSKITFDTIFPHVKTDGAYFVEDWGTGYWSSFVDGKDYQVLPPDGNRIPSHDYGMVGFVKSLVDMTHGYANNPSDGMSIDNYVSPIKILEFGEGVCMMIKGT